MPSFSVVITVFNGERFIDSALTSVFSQTHPADEIIVVNDGSVDGSLDLLRGYDDKIVIVDQANAGVAAARNAGIRCATSEYVAFLDVDDVFRSDKLSAYSEAIAAMENDRPQFVFSDFVREDYCTKERMPSNTELNPWIFEYLSSEFSGESNFLCAAEQSFSLLLRGYAIYPSTMVVARSRLRAIDWDERFRLGEDFCFSLLNASLGSMVYIDKKLVVVTRHDTNSSLDHLVMAQSDVRVLECMLNEQDFSPARRRKIQESLAMRLAGLGWSYRARSRGESLKYYARGLALPGARRRCLLGFAKTLVS